ncbi:class I SAM-dependent methyltransferase [Pararhizobium sp.]|uniref:class I SAM-dependent methyltransferase n=1 Tax=Pararhizobium sp. TaxID=1977563 RepID=UPI0027196332|nr:class I SAM-dependent methyltransferase [Pararhizobium sp.]MDO9415283.1 class I SAM-dependent methyltransferase [Pararhizobium sp.]
MTVDNYTTGRLARLYDMLNPPDEGTRFYLALAGTNPLSILDMGCGTGSLAVDLAQLGHRVTGADPAGAMLEVARHRPGGDRVTWVHSDATGMPVGPLFDLAIMTGHVFQVFLSDADVRAALAGVHAHLCPGGRIAFETRNPSAGTWEHWVPEKTLKRIFVEGTGQVDFHHQLGAVDGELVSFETYFRFEDGEVLVAPSRLRFMARDQLEAILIETGFSRIDVFGDWDRSPVGPESPEIIVVAHKA